MKNTYQYIGLLLLTVFVSTSCEDTIDVDVPNGGARLVVDASIAWEKGTSGQNQSIKLSTSTAYFDVNPDLPVTGANVKITKLDDGTEFNFQHSGNGIYTTGDFIPELNQDYELQIINDGKTYTGTETLVSVVDISNLEQTTDGGDSDDDIEVTIYFDDPADVHNYYLGEFIPSLDQLLTLEPLDDSFTDGNQNFLEYENEDFVAGTSVNINLYGISQQFYNYINILVNQQDGGGPFATTPVQLKGNCKNIADPNEEVLGYFRLGEVDRRSVTIN